MDSEHFGYGNERSIRRTDQRTAKGENMYKLNFVIERVSKRMIKRTVERMIQ